MTTVNKKHLIRAASRFRSKIAIMRLATRFSRALVLLLYSLKIVLYLSFTSRFDYVRLVFFFRFPLTSF